MGWTVHYGLLGQIKEASKKWCIPISMEGAEQVILELVKRGYCTLK